MENKTLFFFHELANIPRESGNEFGIVEYLCAFAKARNLEYYQDAFKNVIIKKKTADKNPLILQAHTDMVCEKKEGTYFNFEKDPIIIIEENGFLKAKNTTLGADNGIGVAQILNILDNDMPCNIEAVFTSEEETTMLGAMNIDTSILSGKNMINLDGFEDNIIIVESAAFNDLLIHTNYHKQAVTNRNIFKISLFGLLGGHSGFEIDKNRGNAIILLASLLNKLDSIEIVYFKGGTKFNVIPSTAEAIFSSNSDLEEIEDILNPYLEELKKDFPIHLKLERDKESSAYSINDSKKLLHSLTTFPNEIYNIHEGKPTTSVNLGIFSTEENIFKLGLRSSRKGEEKEALSRLENFSKSFQYQFEIIGHQPGFESSPNSDLIESLLTTCSQDYYKEKASLKSVHITVEAGFFKEKIPNLEIAIISPKIENAHAPSERVEISSVLEADKWLERLIYFLK